MLSRTALNKCAEPEPMARPTNPINWSDLKRQYVEGTESLAAFARRTGIRRMTLNDRASAEGWNAARKAFQERVAKRAEKAAEDRAFRTAVEISRRQHQIAGNLTVRIGQKVLDGKAKPAELEALARALKLAAEQERTSAGLSATPERLEVEHTGTIGVGLVVLPELDRE